MMAIKLKTKVALGGLFIFALLLLVGILSFTFLNKLTKESRLIVKNNYETLNYSKDMLRALDAITQGDADAAFQLFEQNLVQQESNITEPGEKELTDSLRKHFNTIRFDNKTTSRIDSLLILIRSDISGIMELNLRAIDKKNQQAGVSAEKAKTLIAVILSACVLMGLVFIFNFPSLVATPIAKLTEGIKAIVNKDYQQRIHLNRTDEFGELVNAFNTMAEKLDEYEHSSLAKILFEKQRAETVINSLKDASIGMDNKGTILFANKQALQLLNVKEGDVIGKSQDVLQKRNDLFRFLINEQQNIPFKIVVEEKENYFTREIIDIKQEEEKVGSVIILKNITPYKELDTAKTNFIATISHELKTPLASSDFSLKLLEDERIGSLTQAQKELVQSLKNDNQRLLRILSELLDLSQVESGKIQLQIQAVQPESISDAAINAVLNAAREKNVSIEREIQADLPMINADPEKTTWVLNNFLSNAIRYSPENTAILIRISELPDNMVEFSVKDTGIGIERSFQQKIFDRFFRVPGTNKKGSGLGLSISKEFIEAQDGKIGVESEPGRGSRFYFRLKKYTP